MTLHTAIAPESNSVVLLDEIDAMSRDWSAMADAALDFTSDAYDRAKARFWRHQQRESGR